MKRAVAALATLACLLIGAETHAQMRKNSWEVSPFYGLWYGSTRVGDGSEPIPGLRVGYSLNRWWQLELSYAQLSELAAYQKVGEIRLAAQDDFGVVRVTTLPFDGPADSDVDLVDFNILLTSRPVARRWKFYGTVGIGVSEFQGQMSQSQVDRNFPDGPQRAAFDLNGDGMVGIIDVDGMPVDESMVPTFICSSCSGTELLDPNNPDSQERYLAGGSLDSFDSSQWTLGGGARMHLTDLMALRFDLRYVGGLEENYNAEVLTAGLSFRLGGEGPIDDDEDGIPSFRDICPETPLGATVDGKGCPSDTDGDEVLDGLDQCPGTPAGWPVEPDGCPTDTDGDGVPDGRDACPDTLEGAVVDFEGCAVDSDLDGIPDGLDQCALTPQGAAVDAEGCPIDTDEDGVYDGLDQCPDTATDLTVDALGCPIDSDGDGLRDDVDACRTFGGPGGVDEEGCPILRLDKEVRIQLPEVRFAFGSAVLSDQGKTDLIPLLAAMQYYDSVTVEIEGHTDDIGSERENFLVSLERARAIRDWLVDNGISAERIAIRGYGETRPIADNTTEEGRAQNRRIEVLVTGTLDNDDVL